VKERFPIEEVINYKGNRYELAKACSERAYHLVLKRKEELNRRGKDEALSTNHFEPLKKEEKYSILAMTDILKKKIHFYNADDVKEE